MRSAYAARPPPPSRASQLGLRQAALHAGIARTVDRTDDPPPRAAEPARARPRHSSSSADELCSACHVCQHLCYFSALRCGSCAGAGALCLAHSHEALCGCAPSAKYVELRHSAAALDGMRTELAALVHPDSEAPAAPKGHGRALGPR